MATLLRGHATSLGENASRRYYKRYRAVRVACSRVFPVSMRQVPRRKEPWPRCCEAMPTSLGENASRRYYKRYRAVRVACSRVFPVSMRQVPPRNEHGHVAARPCHLSGENASYDATTSAIAPSGGMLSGIPREHALGAAA